MNHVQSERERLNELSHRIIGRCIEVHREIGPGLLESAYEAAVAFELAKARIPFERQKAQALLYKRTSLSCDYRLDLLVGETLIVEIKAVEEVLPVHKAQLLTYLKLRNAPLGLLINFNVPVLKNGITRMVSGPLFLD